MSTFAVTAEDQRSGWRLLAVHGELDLSTMNVLASTLAVARDEARPVVVDLSTCGFVDSCGIRALVNGSLGHRDSGLAFEVVCPPWNRQVARVLDLVGLDEVVVVRDSIGEPCATGE